MALQTVDYQLAIDSYLTYLGKSLLPNEELAWKEAISIHTQKEELKFTASLYKSASKPACQTILTILRIPDNLPHTFSLQHLESFFYCVVLKQPIEATSRAGPSEIVKICVTPVFPIDDLSHLVAFPDLTFRGTSVPSVRSSVFMQPSDSEDPLI